MGNGTMTYNETVLYKIFFKYKQALSLDELSDITHATKSKLRKILYPSPNFILLPDKKWFTNAIEYESKLLSTVPARIINLYYSDHPFYSIEEFDNILKEIDSMYNRRKNECIDEILKLQQQYHAKRYLDDVNELFFLRDNEYSKITQRLIELDTVVNDIYRRLVIHKQWTKYSNILYCDNTDIPLIIDSRSNMNYMYYGLLQELKNHPFHAISDDPNAYKKTQELENAITNKPIKNNYIENTNSPTINILTTCTGNCSTCERDICINDK